MNTNCYVLDGDLHDLNNGLQYFNQNHAYAPDLDVFGYNSVFQLIVRSNLTGSQTLFADWVLTGADEHTIVERQLAIQELSKELDWCQNFTAYGMHLKEGKKSNQDFISTLTDWLAENVRFIDIKIWSVLNYLLPSGALALLIGVFLGSWTYHWAVHFHCHQSGSSFNYFLSLY